MAFDNITLASYIESPERFAPIVELTKAVLPSIYKMLSPFYAPVSFKLRMMREIKDVMASEGITPNFDITLVKKLKPMAYMRDGGGVYFSLGLLLMKSPLATLPVCLHEISHIILSNMSGYSTLKNIERQFRTEYGALADCDIMSPIELYADLITEHMLCCAYENTETEKKRKRLFRVISHRKEKILAAKEALSRLAKNDNKS